MSGRSDSAPVKPFIVTLFAFMIKSNKGEVSGMTLAVLNDIRAATVD